MSVVPLLTSNWKSVGKLHAEGLSPGFVPVRISLGTARWLPWAAKCPAVHELMPYGLLKRPPLAQDEFESRFIARLDKAGVETIQARLDEIYEEYARPLALLCFEDLSAGEFCHRRMFADWWFHHTGQEVNEADPLPVA
jgi:hypothetical protein